jgi:hypothetical protein
MAACDTKHNGALKGAADFLKAQYISRWGIVNTARHQCIAEHMWGVWMLVTEWGPALGLNPKDQKLAENWALTHDLAEIRTGDCPTPFKTPEVKAALDEMEQQIYPGFLVDKNTAVGAFCKFCDTAESILFLKLNGIGKHADDVRELLCRQMWGRLDGSCIPEEKRLLLRNLFTDTYHQL